MQIAAVINAILGGTLLLYGRKLFWLFIGIAGFFAGVEAAEIALAGRERWLILLSAIAAGLLGAVLAVLVQRLAFALAGLFAGSFLAVHLAQAAGWQDLQAAAFVCGAVIGVLVAVWLTDWAIIALASLVGAVVVTDEFDLDPDASSLLLFTLLILGMLIQGRRLRHDRGAGGDNQQRQV